MKKVGLLYREKLIEQLINNWQEAQACIFIGFDNVTALAFNKLRAELRKDSTSILVSKNSLTRRALGEVNISDADDLLKGSTGIVVVKGEELPKVCKTIIEFSKENTGLILKGGYMGEKKLDQAVLVSLSKLPPREILLAQAIMTMAMPLTGFVAIMNNVILKFVWLVEEIKNKKPAN